MRGWAGAVTAIVLLPAGLVGQDRPADGPAFRILGDTFAALQVRDVEAASAWYAGVFGLDELNRIDAAEPGVPLP